VGQPITDQAFQERAARGADHRGVVPALEKASMEIQHLLLAAAPRAGVVDVENGRKGHGGESRWAPQTGQTSRELPGAGRIQVRELEV
jgi:hypothetical protein